MKALFLLSIYFVCTYCNAQDTLSKWSWGGVVGVDRHYRSLSTESIQADVADEWNELETPAWRISGGLKFEWSPMERFSISTGILYSDRGYEIDSLSEANLNNLEYHFRYVDIPIGLYYTGRKINKNRLFAGVAMNTSFALSNVLFYYKDGQTAQFKMPADESTYPMVLNVSASLGIRRSITNNATVDLYLNGIQSLKSHTDGPLERRFNSVGLFVSILNRF
jgi:hypothetical protein